MSEEKNGNLKVKYNKESDRYWIYATLEDGTDWEFFGANKNQLTSLMFSIIEVIK